MISRRLLLLSGILLPVFGNRDADAQDLVVEVKKMTRSPKTSGAAIFPIFKTNNASLSTRSSQA
jgi:hypothetical protein